jgi:hypothetical protein
MRSNNSRSEFAIDRYEIRSLIKSETDDQHEEEMKKKTLKVKNGKQTMPFLDLLEEAKTANSFL